MYTKPLNQFITLNQLFLILYVSILKGGDDRSKKYFFIFAKIKKKIASI